MRYVGSVTDQSWTRAVLRLNTLERKHYLNQVSATKVHDEAFNFIYGLKRLPRIFTDEYNQQTKENVCANKNVQ